MIRMLIHTLLLSCIGGTSFAKEAKKIVPENTCATGEHWVVAHHRSDYIKADGTYVSATNVSAHCQGNPPAYAVWADRLKSGRPSMWEMKKEKSKAWTEEEKERVLEALSSLPGELLVPSVDGIYRMEKSDNVHSNPGSGHDNQIVLYDGAFKADQNLARVVGHEFAHKLYRQFYDEDGGRGYAQAAQWEAFKNPKTNESFIMAGRDDFVEEDGKNGPDEDFANNIEYYLFKPSVLRAKSPRIYEWIQKKYGDKFKVGTGVRSK